MQDEPLTVARLVELLSQMPPDAVVLPDLRGGGYVYPLTAVKSERCDRVDSERYGVRYSVRRYGGIPAVTIG